MTSCEPDPCRTDVPLDKPIIADGRPLGLYPWSLVCKVYYRQIFECERRHGRVKALLARAHRNVVTVALANKLARIAWAVLARERQYVTVQAIGK